MIGLPYSTSGFACMIRFAGGVWDGQSGLFDHDEYEEIYACDWDSGKTWAYHKVAPQRYAFSASDGPVKSPTDREDVGR